MRMIPWNCSAVHGGMAYLFDHPWTILKNLNYFQQKPVKWTFVDRTIQ
jgi:hypothetical protein